MIRATALDPNSSDAWHWWNFEAIFFLGQGDSDSTDKQGTFGKLSTSGYVGMSPQKLIGAQTVSIVDSGWRKG